MKVHDMHTYVLKSIPIKRDERAVTDGVVLLGFVSHLSYCSGTRLSIRHDP